MMVPIAILKTEQGVMMSWFSRSKPNTVKRLPKLKQLEKRIGDDDECEESDTADIPGTSDYVKEFKEGIDEITELFMDESESGGDKFGKLSFGLANLCNYRNTVFDELVGSGMSETKANSKIKHILIDAGFNDMMIEIVSFREAKKKHKISKRTR